MREPINTLGKGNKMEIVIRTDSSYEIGSGHVMRCLTLAQGLREKGKNVTFISRNLPGNLNVFINKKGFKVYSLPYDEKLNPVITKKTNHSKWLGATWQTDAQQTIEIVSREKQDVDWIVIDHYSLDNLWEKKIRPYAKRVMVIDDLADRLHECDLLLDQNFYGNMDSRYKQLVPNRCITLLGPQYALLRPEFKEKRIHLGTHDGAIRKVLVFFGSSDPTNETLKTLEAIKALNWSDVSYDVVVGAQNPNINQIKYQCFSMPNIKFHFQVSDMAELMADADLAIGAGGSTTWERCCLGLPSLIISVADNQQKIAETCERIGACIYLGISEDITPHTIEESLVKLRNNPILLKQISNNCINIVDGLGTGRVAKVMLEKDRDIDEDSIIRSLS